MGRTRAKKKAGPLAVVAKAGMKASRRQAAAKAGIHTLRNFAIIPGGVPASSASTIARIRAARQFMEMFKAKGAAKTKRRTEGAVTIELEEFLHLKYGPVTRTTRVTGLVEPTATTGRPTAPEPVSGTHVSTAKDSLPKVGPRGEEARNTGMADAQKGHIMALELGGPDVPENIVPQWAQLQSNGEWRQMERAVLARAREVLKDPQNRGLMYDAQVHYKDYGGAALAWASRRSIGTPAGFTVEVWTVKKDGTAGPKITVWKGAQTQNETDDKLALRVFAQTEGDDVAYDDYDPAKRRFAGGQDPLYRPDLHRNGSASTTDID